MADLLNAMGYRTELSPQGGDSGIDITAYKDELPPRILVQVKSQDVYLFCTDGLCGMMQAIEAVFPSSRLQRCIVHQIRASTRYVSYKDIKQVIADLKKIYKAVTLDEAEENLLAFAER